MNAQAAVVGDNKQCEKIWPLLSYKRNFMRLLAVIFIIVLFVAVFFQALVT